MSEDDLNSYEADWNSASVIKSGLKKHTLDSDEEDEGEEKKYEILEDDDIEGQEDGIAGFDGEVQITPFNMKEEMEEGHFDTEGNYHWKKDGKLIRDNWLENIDWVKIKPREGQLDEVMKSDSEDSTPFDQIPTYRQMLAMMKPGETVTKALRRLGGTKTLSASERWRRKKAGQQEQNPEDGKKVTELTEYANKLLTETGNMDIYQETYEHIDSLVKASDAKAVAARPGAKRSFADALDMYADDFDEKEKVRLADRKHKLEDGSSTSGDIAAKRAKTDESVEETKTENSDSKDEDKSGEVQWEYKLKRESEEVNGPHSTQQMFQWMEEKHFKEPVWVRKVGQDGPFYSSSRVDFDLYL